MTDLKALQNKATEIRIRLIELIHSAKTGHTGGSLSSVDLLVSLYYEVLKVDPSNPQWLERDKFLMSKGHAVEGYFCVLADLGFFPKEELDTFSAYKSRLIGHPTRKVPGVEMNTGALGHGLPVGVGMALAAKRRSESNRVFVLMGDGEQAEGSIWEAAMAASHYNLGNLVSIIDRNYLQISGNTEDVMSLDSLSDKWASFGWNAIEIDGNNIEEICSTLENVDYCGEKPTAIIAKTTKGKGVSFMENNPKWHHGVPVEKEYETAISDLKAAYI